MTQGEPQPPTKEFRCKNCRRLISPPEIVQPMILGGTTGGDFRISITYPCDYCETKHQTQYHGKILIDGYEIKRQNTE